MSVDALDAVALRDHLGIATIPPRLAVILGSGLGGVTERLQSRRSVPYSRIAGLPDTKTAGHAGVLHSGMLGGAPAILMSGRFHRYEGRSTSEIISIVALVHALGARNLIITNAAGGITGRMHPGALMLVTGHIDLMFAVGNSNSNGSGDGEPGDDRRMCRRMYDGAIRGTLRTTAAECGLAVSEGVYAAVTGPSYETRAEIRMLRSLGADAVGMSTVPEVQAASMLGVRCAAISCITNYAAGHSADPLSHAEVLSTGARMQDDLGKLLAGFSVRIRI
jgi:purine-nucleoside phosphorylase